MRSKKIWTVQIKHGYFSAILYLDPLHHSQCNLHQNAREGRGSWHWILYMLRIVNEFVCERLDSVVAENLWNSSRSKTKTTSNPSRYIIWSNAKNSIKDIKTILKYFWFKHWATRTHGKLCFLLKRWKHLEITPCHVPIRIVRLLECRYQGAKTNNEKHLSYLRLSNFK